MSEQMNFGDALRGLKQGLQVAREGWNGKGMWLVLVTGRVHAESDPWRCPSPTYTVRMPLPLPPDPRGNDFAAWLSASPEESGPDAPRLLPFIAMKTADNGFVPWVASQTDMLAEDWVVLS